MNIIEINSEQRQELLWGLPTNDIGQVANILLVCNTKTGNCAVLKNRTDFLDTEIENIKDFDTIDDRPHYLDIEADIKASKISKNIILTENAFFNKKCREIISSL